MSYPCFLTFEGINFAIFKEKIPPRASNFLKALPKPCMNFKQFTSSPYSHFARQFFYVCYRAQVHMLIQVTNFQKRRTNFQQHFLLICIFYVRHDDDLIYLS